MRKTINETSQGILTDVRKRHKEQYPFAPSAFHAAMARPTATDPAEFLDQAAGNLCDECAASQPEQRQDEWGDYTFTGACIALSQLELIEQRRRVRRTANELIYSLTFRSQGFYNDFLIAMWGVTRKERYADRLIQQQRTKHLAAAQSARWALNSLCHQHPWFAERFAPYLEIEL